MAVWDSCGGDGKDRIIFTESERSELHKTLDDIESQDKHIYWHKLPLHLKLIICQDSGKFLKYSQSLFHRNPGS